MGNTDQNHTEIGTCPARDSNTLATPTSQYQSPSDSKSLVVNSIEDAQQFLKIISEEYPAALARVAQSQLDVLQTIRTPSMSLPVIDILLENMTVAIDSAGNDEQVKNIRKIAALTVKNIVFYQHALLEYEKQKHSEASRSLCISAGRMFDNTLGAVFDLTTGINGPLPGIRVVNAVAAEISREGFFVKLFNWLFSKDKLEQQALEYYQALGKLSRKLVRLRNIFGGSSLLAETIEDNVDEMTIYDVNVYEKKKAWDNTKNSWLQRLLLFFIFPFSAFYWNYRYTDYICEKEKTQNGFKSLAWQFQHENEDGRFRDIDRGISRKRIMRLWIPAIICIIIFMLPGIVIIVTESVY